MSLYKTPAIKDSTCMHTCSESSCKKKMDACNCRLFYTTIQRKNTEYMFIMFIACHMHDRCGKRIVRQTIVYRSMYATMLCVCMFQNNNNEILNSTLASSHLS